MSFTEEDLDKPERLTEKERAQLKSKINFLEIDICNKKWELVLSKNLLNGGLVEEGRFHTKSKISFLKADIDNETEHIELLKKLLKGNK